mgnify:FL=1
MRKKVILMPIIFLLLMILLVGCAGKGNLKVIVLANGQGLDDSYVALYTTDYSQRVRFGYTVGGEIEFRGIDSGTYILKVIGVDYKVKKGKVHIDSEKTPVIKIEY